MKNLRHFPVYLFILVKSSIFLASEGTYLSNWTTLLWVKAEARVSPLDVWTSSSYPTAAGNLDFSLKSLYTAQLQMFRSGKIDNWSLSVPSRLRLLFLSETGSPLIMHDFNSSYANSTDWFSATNLLQTSLPLHDQFDIRYNSPLEVTFGVHSQPEGVFGLYAGALQYNSSEYFLFSGNGSLLYLPGLAKSSSTLCQINPLGKYFLEFCVYLYAQRDQGTSILLSENRRFSQSELICRQMGSNGSISTPLSLMRNFTHNRGNLCVAFCRQNNFNYSFLYGMTCGCDNKLPNTAQLPCNIPCPGNSLELCGGLLSLLYVSAKIFENVVNVAAFNPNTFDATKTWTFQGTGEFNLGSPFYFRYGSITLPVNATVGSNLTLELSHKLVACNDYTEEFYITTINITVMGSTTNISLGETIGIVCAKMKLEDTAGIVGYSVTLNASYKTGPTLLTAPILAVQAAWEMCDCDCWVYQLLYGDSPYKNMTYAEKEQALQDTIAKIQKELTVNTSELSATIRKKTSAEDSRVSAIVVGYTLGVALLSFSLGSIIIFDLPRLLEGFRALLHNLTGR